MKKAIVIAVLVTLICSLSVPASSIITSKKVFPRLQLTTIQGKSLDTKSLRGKVVLLDIWATWCPPCRMEIPHLQKLHNSYSSKGLVVIGVSLGEGKEKPKAFAHSQKLTYTIAFTDSKAGDQLSQKLQVDGIPKTYIIDKKGNIAAVEVGFDPDSTPQKLEKKIKSLLKTK